MNENKYQLKASSARQLIEERQLKEGDLLLLIYDNTKDGHVEGVHFAMFEGDNGGNGLNVRNAVEFGKPRDYGQKVTMPDVRLMCVAGPLPLSKGIKVYVNPKEIAYGLKQTPGWEFYAQFFDNKD